ncbi:MAG: Eco57I restriction-modification methylase domain-containing protein, partial [Candidatus Kapaibacterium sp.]
MQPPEELFELIRRFEDNEQRYKSNQYNEAQLRQEFINPLFALMGWDIYNSKGYAEQYKDVVHEDSVKVGGMTKAPDYSFRIGSQRKFFLEAKRPSVDIKGDIHPAYQLRRYAWSAKLPLSILSDFEEMAVYDCRKKPVKTDKASTARIKYYNYKEYPDKWDEIVGIFGPEAIKKGSFDRFAESTGKKRGTAEVDDAFLAEMERWRELLARNIALRNRSLSTRALNEAVQKTIDRIVFLRICEDRGIEEYGQLRKLLNVSDVYSHMRQIFLRADDVYNSGLFHFTEERDRAEPDEWTLDLEIDDITLKDIVRCLYYPDSPYEFSVLPADILGQVYERFLGKVIRLTPGHQAKIDEKPEVRKAGGVYYTPTYIVDYIVRNTVGKLLEGKTPDEASRLRIVDPACGSGSFLLGAYQRLLDWHLEQYSAKPEKYMKGAEPKIYDAADKDYRLTTAEKKRILLNNIYGVDIDSQAVEVTKLSLLLKVLEDETRESLGLTRQFRINFKMRALPDLSANIKCGNSLIGPDFYSGKDLQLFGEEELYRINVFDWAEEFPEVFGRKELQAFHITWATRNSRISERMILTNAQKGEPVYLDEKMIKIVIGAIEEKVREEGLRILAVNVLPDHVHLILVCEEKETEEIVRKLKGYASYRIGRELKLSVAGEGRTTRIWARGYSATGIRGEDHLRKAINYIRYNHIKHGYSTGNSAPQPADDSMGSAASHNSAPQPADDSMGSAASHSSAPQPADDSMGSAASHSSAPQLNTRNSGLQPAGYSIHHTIAPELLAPVHKAFQPIVSGGFDAVIGNPPYVQLSMYEYFNEDIKKYLLQKYNSSMGRMNTYGFFIVNSLNNILKEKGYISYIVPNTILTQEYYQKLRQELLNNNIKKICNYVNPVFKNAVVETVVLVIQKGTFKPNVCQIVNYDNKKEVIISSYKIDPKIYHETYKNAFNTNLTNDLINLKVKIEKNSIALNSTANINQAIALKHDRSKSLFNEKLDVEYKPVLDGKNINKYLTKWTGLYLKYDVNNIHSCKRKDIFEAREKILFRRVGASIIATYDDDQFFALNTLIVLTMKSKGISLKYVLGLINSKLLNYYYFTYLKSTKKIFSEIQARQMGQLPIPKIDFGDADDKSRHDR